MCEPGRACCAASVPVIPTTVAYPGTERLIISGKTEATEASKRNKPGSDRGDEKSSSRCPGGLDDAGLSEVDMVIRALGSLRIE